MNIVFLHVDGVLNFIILDDRLIIKRELSLDKYIGNLLNKDCTTISKKVQNHYKIKNSKGYGRVFNNYIM